MNSHIRNVLFQRYCTSFYGTQIVPLFDKCINEIYKAWRIAIRRIWHNILQLIARVIDPEFWFAKRSINLLNIALNSSSQNIKWISNMGCFGTYSIMGGNIRLLIEKYDMNLKNVMKAWNERTSKNEE